MPPPPPLSPAGQPLAGFGDRFLAYLVDMAVFMVVSMIIMVPVMIIYFGSLGDEMSRAANEGPAYQPDFFEFFLPFLLIWAATLVLMLVAYYVYHVEMMFRTGQTLGKRAMKLRVVPLEGTGPLTRGVALRRYLAQFVAGAFLPGFSYLDGLWQLWDKPYQQCLHDKFARTVVVKVPS